jgi:hypothetical protein
VLALTVMTGAFFVRAGAGRLGFMADFLSQPILTGYLNGIALLIIVGQLPKLFGYSAEPARTSSGSCWSCSSASASAARLCPEHGARRRDPGLGGGPFRFGRVGMLGEMGCVICHN